MAHYDIDFIIGKIYDNFIKSNGDINNIKEYLINKIDKNEIILTSICDFNNESFYKPYINLVEIELLNYINFEIILNKLIVSQIMNTILQCKDSYNKIKQTEHGFDKYIEEYHININDINDILTKKEEPIEKYKNINMYIYSKIYNFIGILFEELVPYNNYYLKLNDTFIERVIAYYFAMNNNYECMYMIGKKFIKEQKKYERGLELLMKCCDKDNEKNIFAIIELLNYVDDKYSFITSYESIINEKYIGIYYLNKINYYLKTKDIDKTFLFELINKLKEYNLSYFYYYLGIYYNEFEEDKFKMIENFTLALKHNNIATYCYLILKNITDFDIKYEIELYCSNRFFTYYNHSDNINNFKLLTNYCLKNKLLIESDYFNELLNEHGDFEFNNNYILGTRFNDYNSIIKMGDNYKELKNYELIVYYYKAAYNISKNINDLYNIIKLFKISNTRYIDEHIPMFNIILSYITLLVSKNHINTIKLIKDYHYHIKDYNTMKKQCLMLIDKNQTNEMLFLGNYYINHENDVNKAIKYYQMAVDNNNYDGLIYIAIILFRKKKNINKVISNVYKYLSYYDINRLKKYILNNNELFNILLRTKYEFFFVMYDKIRLFLENDKIFKTNKKYKYCFENSFVETDNNECCICWSNFNSSKLLAINFDKKCNHTICTECYIESTNLNCPFKCHSKKHRN